MDSESKSNIAVPPTEIRQFWDILRLHYVELLGLNLLFAVTSIPIITIPAATSGMIDILLKWTRGQPVFFWSDYFDEFRNAFWGRLLIWLLLVIAPVSLSLYPTIIGVRLSVSLIFILAGTFSLLFQIYFFPITVLVDIPVGAAIKNAVILSVIEWKLSIRILLITGIIIIASINYPFVTLILVIFGLPVIFQLMLCVWVMKPIERWIIADQ